MCYDSYHTRTRGGANSTVDTCWGLEGNPRGPCLLVQQPARQCRLRRCQQLVHILEQLVGASGTDPMGLQQLDDVLVEQEDPHRKPRPLAVALAEQRVGGGARAAAVGTGIAATPKEPPPRRLLVNPVEQRHAQQGGVKHSQ